jgi:serine/threonine protein kinase
LNAYGAIYPYLGFYNLDKIKSIKYKISWIHNISIIKQLIKQVDSFTNIIHGDLKPPNVVLDIRDNRAVATIVDFGLIKKKKDKFGIISTNYVSSPESILTLKEYSVYKDPDEIIDCSKHDYFGLFCICLNLFLEKSYWSIFSKYILDVFKVSNDYLLEHKAVLLFVYAWYKFFYTSINQLPSQSFKNLITYIEKTKVTSEIKNNFLSWDNFFNNYVVTGIDDKTFDSNHLKYFKDFLIKLIHFDSSERSDLKELMEHKFLKLD